MLILIKQKEKKEKKNRKKIFWLNICLDKECPELLCGLDIGHKRRRGIVRSGGGGGGGGGVGGILQGITVCLVSAVLSTL